MSIRQRQGLPVAQIQDLLRAGSAWCDVTKPYGFRPNDPGGPTCLPDGWSTEGSPGGTMIDVRIPEADRRRMALGETPVLTFQEWSQRQPGGTDE